MACAHVSQVVKKLSLVRESPHWKLLRRVVHILAYRGIMTSGQMEEQRNDYSHLLPQSWTVKVAEWLQEDCPSFDWGGFVVGDGQRTAHLNAKASGVLAGVPFFDEVFRQLDCTVEWHYKEGDYIDVQKDGKGRVVAATVKGSVRKLLLGERVALNTLARCSGIATASKLFLDKARSAGYSGIVAGTRKTTPGECDVNGRQSVAVIDLLSNRIPTRREVRYAGGRNRHAQKRSEQYGDAQGQSHLGDR